MHTYRFRDETGRSSLRDTTEAEAVEDALAWQRVYSRRMRVYRVTADGDVEVPVPSPLVRTRDRFADFRVGRRSARGGMMTFGYLAEPDPELLDNHRFAICTYPEARLRSRLGHVIQQARPTLPDSYAEACAIREQLDAIDRQRWEDSHVGSYA